MALAFTFFEVGDFQQIPGAFAFSARTKEGRKAFLRATFIVGFLLVITRGIITGELTIIAIIFGAFCVLPVVFEVLVLGCWMMVWFMIFFEVYNEGSEVLVQVKALFLACRFVCRFVSGLLCDL